LTNASNEDCEAEPVCEATQADDETYCEVVGCQLGHGGGKETWLSLVIDESSWEQPFMVAVSGHIYILLSNLCSRYPRLPIREQSSYPRLHSASRDNQEGLKMYRRSPDHSRLHLLVSSGELVRIVLIHSVWSHVPNRKDESTLNSDSSVENRQKAGACDGQNIDLSTSSA
jgi:hypothetical protein